MDNDLPGILQVNTQDYTGGAAHIAWNIFKGLEKKGCRSYFAVGKKESRDPAVFLISNDQNRNSVARFFITLGNITRKIPVLRRHRTLLTLAGQPERYRNYLQGFEDFDFPGTRTLATIIPNFSPDIIHCHNLHGGYFDLRELPGISRQTPVILTLHDAWLFSGHCAHSFACEKWKTGCGNCPDLTIYPAIRKDVTAENWRKKQEIFSECRLYVSTPCQWLMDKVNDSQMKPAIIKSQVIPNGVDLKIFHPANQTDARVELALPIDTKILLFTADGIRKNIWKDYRTLQSTLEKIATSGIKVLCLALGEKAPPEHFGGVEIRFIPYIEDPDKVARYYQVADLYIHPACADTFPNTILEALACGIPVVASSVGGIPEQIVEGKTGFLVPSGDAQLMAKRIMQLLADDIDRKQMGLQAADDAARRFGLDRMVDEYIQLYREL